MFFFFLLCYSKKVVAVRKDKIMSKSIMQFFTVNLVSFIGTFFMIIYISVTKNILDVCYLLFILIYSFRMRYCEWKKYH